MKSRLLEQVAEYLIKNGIGGATLRPLAKSIGTSDRMLIYYFGSKDALLASAVESIADKIIYAVENSLESKPATPGKFILDLWNLFVHPSNRHAAYLFLEVEVLSLRHVKPYRQIAQRLLARWSQLIDAGLTRAGLPPKELADLGTAIGAELVGLFLIHFIRGEDVAKPALERLLYRIDSAAKKNKRAPSEGGRRKR